MSLRSNSQPLTATTLIIDPLEISPGKLTKTARVISDVMSPPIFGVACLLTLGFSLRSAMSWFWMGIFLVLTVLVPTLYVFWLVKRGEVTDFHVPIRSQRYRPMILMLAMASFSTLILLVMDTPVILSSIVLIGDLLMTILFLITLKWKISGHTISVTTFAVICSMLLGEMGWLVFLLVPIVVWARLRLHRHTPAQTVAGFLLGLMLFLAFI